MDLLYFFLCFTVFGSSLSQVTLTGTNSKVSASSTGADYPTGRLATYASDASTATFITSSEYASLTKALASSMTGASSSTDGTRSTSPTNTQTLLVGGANSTTTSQAGTHNAKSTSSSAIPTNTQPCNGYPKLCNRKFSNITYVAAHNSPFIQPNNVARNQMLDVTTQLNDGIRMLEMQTHYLDGKMYLCHTSCDLLNAGTLEAYLHTVTQWLRANPYEVITILMGNQDFVLPQNYTQPFTASGLIDYAYIPPKMPMGLDDWPTLAEMILLNKRAVIMLDYQANQKAIPWLLDEFSQMWETPFSPTNRSFPCTPQRPPNAPREVYENRMFMANHNLNIEVDVAGLSLELPAFNLIKETNAVVGYGSAGLTADTCTQDWSRSPNFLLVDFYNIGTYNASSTHTPTLNGSVFEVAARANNVVYHSDSCCGTAKSSKAALGRDAPWRGYVSVIISVLWSLYSL